MKSRCVSLPALLVLLALTLSLVAGCERIEDAITPGPRIVTKEATVAAPAAQVTGELPEGTPSELPIWPGSTVADSEASAGTVTLTLSTTSAYRDVVAGTSVGFERAGWTVAEEAAEASATVLNVKGEGYDGFVTVTETESGVTVDYLLAEAAN